MRLFAILPSLYCADESSALLQFGSSLARSGQYQASNQLAEDGVSGELAVLAARTAHLASENAGGLTLKQKEDFLGEMKKVSDVMTVALEDVHGDAEDEWKVDLAKHQLCHNQTADRFDVGGDIYLLDHDATQSGAKHKACRKAEQAWGNYVSAGAACSGSGMDFMETLQVHEDVLQTLSAFKVSRQEYLGTAPTDASTPTSCDANQAVYEAAVCSRRTSQIFACNAEAGCIAAVGLEQTKARLQARETKGHNDELAIQVSMCNIRYIIMHGIPNVTENAGEQVLAGEHVPNNTCAEQVFNVSQSLKLDLPQSPSCVVDHAASQYPMQDQCHDWLAAAYQSWNSSYKQPTVCQKHCVATPVQPEPKPAPIAGCTDSATKASDCLMFEHHSDVCNHQAYKVDGFDPTVECCACGGGIHPTTTTTTTTTTKDDNFPCFTKDTDECLRKAWGVTVYSGHTCSTEKRYCLENGGHVSEYKHHVKDLHRCCPVTCGVEPICDMASCEAIDSAYDYISCEESYILKTHANGQLIPDGSSDIRR